MGFAANNGLNANQRWRRAIALHCSALAALGLPFASGLAQARTSPRKHTVLVVGDSLSAGYGLSAEQGWVALLEQRLKRDGLPVQLINASISGDTSSGGRSRLPPLLTRHQPSVVVIELGGNDALRGLPLPQVQDNLTAMVRAARQNGAAVILVGVAVPPNYGRRYSEDFARLFVQVAQAERTAVVPSLLTGVADAPDSTSLFQADRIHPNAQAQARMLGNVWPVLRPLLK